MASRGLPISSFTGHGPTLTRDQALTRVRMARALQPYEILRTGETVCGSCKEPFGPEDAIKTSCSRNHVYGRECLYTWLETKDSCPVCRDELHRDGDDDESVDQGLWETDDEGRPVVSSDDGDNIFAMRNMAASGDALEDIGEMARRRMMLFQAGELTIDLSDYAKPQRQHFTYGLALPDGQYDIDALPIIDRLHREFWTALEHTLLTEDPNELLDVVAHPLAAMVMQRFLRILTVWSKECDFTVNITGELPRATAADLEFHLRQSLAEDPMLVEVRRLSMPGGDYPEQFSAWVADMVDYVIEMAVGEEGLQAYVDGNHGPLDSRMEW